MSSLIRSLALLGNTTVVRGYLKGAVDSASSITGAVKAFRRALSLDAHIEARAHIGIGVCLELCNDWKGALEAYQRSIELEPHDADGYERIGVLQFHFGQYKACIKSFTTALSLAPHKIFVTLNLAIARVCYEEQNSNLLATIYGILKQHPDSDLGHFVVGIIRLSLGEAEKAVASLKQAIDLRDRFGLPPVADYSGSLAQAYEESGRGEEVEIMLQSCIDQDPASLDLQFELGAYYQRTFQYKAAFQRFESANGLHLHWGACHAIGTLQLASG